MDELTATGIGVGAFLQNGMVPLLETLANASSKLDSQLEENAKHIDSIMSDILKMVNELPNSKQHNTAEEAVEFLNTSNLFDKNSCFDADFTDIQAILKRVQMIMDAHPNSEDLILSDLLEFSAREGISLPVYSSAYERGLNPINDSLASINAVVDASELQIQQQWDEICERFRRHFLDKLNKLPVLTRRPIICIEELKRWNYISSLLCLYPVQDVWRDYKNVRSRLADKCMRELMPSLTGSANIDAVVKGFVSLCDIFIFMISEDFLIFSTGIFKDVATTYDAINDLYLEKIADELISIIEYIHDATIKFDSAQEMHKSKSEQVGFLSQLRQSRASSAKSLDALLLTKSQEQLADDPFSSVFLQPLVGLVIACNKVEMHVSELYNMGTWKPSGAHNNFDIRSVLKTQNPLPLQNQPNSMDVFMGTAGNNLCLPSTDLDLVPEGEVLRESATEKSVHGSELKWEWQLTFKKLVSDIARHVELTIQSVATAELDNELCTYSTTRLLPMVPVCWQLRGGRLDYPPLVAKSIAAFFVQLEQLLPLVAVGQNGVFYTVWTAFIDTAIQSLKSFLERVQSVCGDVPSKSTITCLCQALANVTFVRNQLQHYEQVLGKGEQRCIFETLVRQFAEQAECITQQLIKYHCDVISTGVLHDAESHDWANSKPFYEDERCSFSVQNWHVYMEKLHHQLWHSVPPKLAQTILLTVVHHSLSQLTFRYSHVKPSYKRTTQFRSDVTAILLCTSELLFPLCTATEQLHNPVIEHGTLLYQIHNFCCSLLASLIVVTCPLNDLYKAFKKGMPCNVKKKQEGIRVMLSTDSIDVETITAWPSHWLWTIRPGVFSPNCVSISQMQTTNAVYIYLKLLDSQPQPDWSLLLQVLLVKDYTLPIMLLTLSPEHLTATPIACESVACDGVLCNAESCKELYGQCENLYLPFFRVISHCSHIPDALAKIIEPIIDRNNLWFILDASVIPGKTHPVPPLLKVVFRLMEPFFNRVLEPALREIMSKPGQPQQNVPNFAETFPDLPCGCQSNFIALQEKKSAKKAVLQSVVKSVLSQLTDDVMSIPTSLCLAFAHLQDLLRAHIQQPAHNCVGLQIIAAGLYYHLHNAEYLEEILGIRIKPIYQEKFNTLARGLYELIVAMPSSIKPRRPSEEIAQGFLLTHQDWLQNKMDTVKTFFSNFMLQRENQFEDASQDFINHMMEAITAEILVLPHGQQDLFHIYHLLKHNMAWLKSQLDIPPLYPQNEPVGIVPESFNSSTTLLQRSPSFNPLKISASIDDEQFDQESIRNFPYNWQKLLQSDLGLSEIGMRHLLFNRHEMQDGAYIEEHEKKPVEALRATFDRDHLELS